MSKNLLQEYFQKRSKPIPIYKTIQLIKIDENGNEKPIFISKLVINDIEYCSDLFSSKKDSEQDVACKAYNSLTSQQELTDYVPPLLYKNLILIDLENINTCLTWRFPPESKIVGFTSKYSSIYSTKDRYTPYMKLKVIDSHINDAADILLITYLMKRIDKVEDIFIITRDHYAAVLKIIFPKKNIKQIIEDNFS